MRGASATRVNRARRHRERAEGAWLHSKATPGEDALALIHVCAVDDLLQSTGTRHVNGWRIPRAVRAVLLAQFASSLRPIRRFRGMQSSGASGLFGVGELQVAGDGVDQLSAVGAMGKHVFDH